MTHRWDRFKRALLPLLLLSTVLFSNGCATLFNSEPSELPPILAQDELLRPYQKIGNIEVRRERYGSPMDLTPSDYSWGYHALRVEAAKIGADAVILPEVKSEQADYMLFPTSDMTARGIAIKFR